MTSVHVVRHLGNEPTPSEPGLSADDEFQRGMNAEESSKSSPSANQTPLKVELTEFQIWLSVPFHNLPVVLDPAMSVRQSLFHDLWTELGISSVCSEFIVMIATQEVYIFSAGG
jgi:hypothetical protein